MSRRQVIGAGLTGSVAAVAGRSMIAQQSSDASPRAWANGLNAYVASHKDNLPVEFELTGTTPDPWTAKTVVLRWAELTIDSIRANAVQEIQLAMNAR